MMYESKMAAAIKVGGKVLREFKDTVRIPFGSEYSILIKNLNTTRAVAHVFIDGEDVVSGGLVIDPGREIDLERWVKNGNLTEGNRFKFIERTGAVEQHRGVKLEDGLVRIEFQFEQPPRPLIWNNNINYGDSGIYPAGSILRSSTNNSWPAGSINCSATYDSYSVSATSAVVNQVNDAGITVPGSKSEQKFSTTYVGALESTKHSMVFKLLGGETIREAVTVKHKPRCQTCGHTNKATAQYCNKCGTALVIYA